jgi:stearoyl-CoA desaturase (delta-9 desaturase)
MSVTTLEARAPSAQATDSRDRIDWLGAGPFLLVHVAALAAFFLPFGATELWLCAGLYLLRMFAITAGYHRYFSHRTFKTGRAFQFVLAVLAVSSVQKGILWWAGHHRDHHRDSDTERDIHSPVQSGFWWSHVTWILSRRHTETKLDRIRDFARFPELRWLDDWHLVPYIALCVALFAIGGAPWLVWGGFVSTVLLWHGTFTINSLAHVIGSRRYETKDQSRNNWLLALITLGEGWHNNHHHYQSSVRQGFFWWELDVTYYVLRLLALCGLVWDLREPPKRLLKPQTLLTAP